MVFSVSWRFFDVVLLFIVYFDMLVVCMNFYIVV